MNLYGFFVQKKMTLSLCKLVSMLLYNWFSFFLTFSYWKRFSFNSYFNFLYIFIWIKIIRSKFLCFEHVLHFSANFISERDEFRMVLRARYANFLNLTIRLPQRRRNEAQYIKLSRKSYRAVHKI